MDFHSTQPLPPGTPVEVFSPFTSSWVSGFDVATTREDCYELRRRSDRSVLPTTFHVDDLRVEHRSAMTHLVDDDRDDTQSSDKPEGA